METKTYIEEQVAITSPDAELHHDAADYFSRHMRVLEQCINFWPMPHVKAQIDALREAFSEDTGKPFVLKRSFPYPSPVKAQYQNIPTTRVTGHGGHEGSSMIKSHQLEYSGHSLSPPLSSPGLQSQAESPSSDIVSTPSPQGHMTGTGTVIGSTVPTTLDPTRWNPRKIFE